MIVEPWLQRAAHRDGARTALRTPHAELTYAQLHARACAGAHWLATQGIAPGDRVAIELPADESFVVALHACLLRGAVVVPIDARLTEQERDAQVAGALRITAPLPAATADAAADAPGHDLGAPALVIHTSGTTAAPRPVTLTYGNLLWSALGSAVALGLDRDAERWLCAMPLSHVGGLSILLRSTIYGTTAVLHERFETDRVLDELRDGGVTLVSVVATTLQRLLDAGLRGERAAALRCALAGGGPVPAALLARAHDAGVPVRLTYGMTESCSQATTVPLAVADAQAPTWGAGPPLFCTRVRIATDGEILLSGPTIAPDAAAADDGWLHTGDLGSLDAETGALHVTGRRSDTIISGGENVAPAEVEAVLEQHPDVAEAAVVARADPRWGEAVTALVVPRDGAGIDAEELRAHCATALAPYKIPRNVIALDEPLPRTRSGKLLRRELA